MIWNICVPKIIDWGDNLRKVKEVAFESRPDDYNIQYNWEKRFPERGTTYTSAWKAGVKNN